jgi:hypothetical protein
VWHDAFHEFLRLTVYAQIVDEYLADITGKMIA